MEIDSTTQQCMVNLVLGGQHLSDSCFKCSCDISVVLSAGLKVRTAAVLLTPGPCFVLPHLPLLHVYLVAKYHKREPLGVFNVRVVHELFLPAAKVLETLQVVHSKREQATVSAAVEGGAQGLEALLTCRVPDLKSDQAPVHLQVPVEELYTDSVEGLGVKAVCDIAVHQGGLAYSAIPQQDHLQQQALPAHHASLPPGRKASSRGYSPPAAGGRPGSIYPM